jgi:hypothetical protein
MDDSRGNGASNLGLPFPLGLSLLSIGTVLVARGLSRALPGTFGGIDPLIHWVGLGADLGSQLSALVFGIVSLRMMILVLVSSRALPFKLLVSTAVLATVSAVWVSADPGFHPHPGWLLWMGGALVALSTAVAARALLGSAGLRGFAIGLLALAMAGLGHLASRWLVLDTDEPISLEAFGWARLVATGAFAAELLAMGVGLAWLVTAPPGPARSPILMRVELPVVFWSIAGLAVALVPALVLASGEEGWRLLLERTLSALRTHPDPLVPGWLTNLAELLAFALCFLALLPWRREPQLRTALVLVVLGRSSFDVPLGGLLVLSGLLAVVPFLPVATRREPLTRPSGQGERLRRLRGTLGS